MVEVVHIQDGSAIVNGLEEEKMSFMKGCRTLGVSLLSAALTGAMASAASAAPIADNVARAPHAAASSWSSILQANAASVCSSHGYHGGPRGSYYWVNKPLNDAWGSFPDPYVEAYTCKGSGAFGTTYGFYADIKGSMPYMSYRIDRVNVSYVDPYRTCAGVTYSWASDPFMKFGSDTLSVCTPNP